MFQFWSPNLTRIVKPGLSAYDRDPMNRALAIALLGGNVSCAAEHLGITYQAVYQWPDDLPPITVTKVTEALAWMHCERQLRSLGLSPPHFSRAAARQELLRGP